MYWMTFVWPWPKVTTQWHWSTEKLVCTIKSKRHLSITIKLGSSIHLVMLITWLNFGEILWELFVLTFFFKFHMYFFKGKHSIGYILGMVGSIDMKQKGSTLVGYWVNCVTLTFDLTHELDLGFFMVKVWNRSKELKGRLTWNERDVNRTFMTIGLWPLDKHGGVGEYTG